MNAVASSTHRRGGRAEKRMARAHSLAHDSEIVSASMVGGTYRPLTVEQIERINDTALRILETYGMADAGPNVQETLLRGGGVLTDDGRILISRDMVAEAMRVAGRSKSRGWTESAKWYSAGTG